MTEQRYRWARAFRNGEQVCGRVVLIVGHDADSLGVTPSERRYVTARFRERLHPDLHRDLARLLTQRGRAVRDFAAQLEPIELLSDHPRVGRQRILGQLEPPLVRHGEIGEVEFEIREIDPHGRPWTRPRTGLLGQGSRRS